MTFISSLNEDNLEIFISLFNEFFKSGYFLSHISKNHCSIDIIILRQIFINSSYSCEEKFS